MFILLSDIRDCKDWADLGHVTDGTYVITPDDQGTLAVYCDMKPARQQDGTATNGWIVIQRRVSDSVDFKRYEKRILTLLG